MDIGSDVLHSRLHQTYVSRDAMTFSMNHVDAVLCIIPIQDVYIGFRVYTASLSSGTGFHFHYYAYLVYYTCYQMWTNDGVRIWKCSSVLQSEELDAFMCKCG